MGPRPDYMKPFFELEYQTNKVLVKILHKSGEDKIPVEDVNVLDDALKYITWNGHAKYILTPNKLYATKQKDNKTGKKTYGVLKDGRHFVLDFKTRDMKGKNKPTFYPEFSLQLSAYKAKLDAKLGVDHVPLSVLIDMSDIQCIHSKEYTDDEMQKAYKTFLGITKAFYLVKNIPEIDRKDIRCL